MFPKQKKNNLKEKWTWCCPASIISWNASLPCAHSQISSGLCGAFVLWTSEKSLAADNILLCSVSVTGVLHFLWIRHRRDVCAEHSPHWEDMRSTPVLSAGPWSPVVSLVTGEPRERQVVKSQWNWVLDIHTDRQTDIYTYIATLYIHRLQKHDLISVGSKKKKKMIEQPAKGQSCRLCCEQTTTSTL